MIYVVGTRDGKIISSGEMEFTDTDIYVPKGYIGEYRKKVEELKKVENISIPYDNLLFHFFYNDDMANVSAKKNLKLGEKSTFNVVSKAKKLAATCNMAETLKKIRLQSCKLRNLKRRQKLTFPDRVYIVGVQEFGPAFGLEYTKDRTFGVITKKWEFGEA